MMRTWISRKKGIVMPTVVAVVAIVTLLGFTAAFLVESDTKMGNRYSSREKALHFAEAGLNKYLWHLNKDYKYYERTTFGSDELEPGVATAFQNGHYYVEVDAPTTTVPVVTIRATGWPDSDPSSKVTVEAQVHKKQFVQQIYCSNVERTPSGQTVWWITGDNVYGPLHTNGQLNIDGSPAFHDKATYSGADPQITWGSSPSFAIEGDPEKVAQLAFPASNSQLKIQAQLNGYYFDGRTCIMLNGSQIKIRHRNGNVETRSLPPNGVIYVDGTSGSKWDLAAGNAFVSGTLDGRLTIAAAKDIYITHRDPTNTTYSAATPTGGLVYQNTDFTGDDMTDDMLGLIANGYVRILHYDWPRTTSPYYSSVGDVAPQNITIHAAIFALNWAFEYESYSSGSLKGTITMVGSMTQNYRGAVGTFYLGGGRVTGYLKSYHHDPRMAYDTPPHFLEPVNAGWEIISWKETASPDI